MRTEGPRGQALPLAIAGLFISALLFAFVLRGTERLIQRERVRARTDATAFSGANAYARGLNVLAASQKAVAFGWVALIFDGGQTKARVQKLQNALMAAGPFVNLAVTANVAYENGLWVLPVWNQEVLLEDLSHKDLIPSYNIQPYSVQDAAVEALKNAGDRLAGDSTEAKDIQSAIAKDLKGVEKKYGDKAKEEAARLIRQQLPGREIEGLIEIDHFEYKRGGKEKIIVAKEDASLVWEDGPYGKKKVARYKAGKKHKYRYVAKVEHASPDFQLSLEEGDPHMLTLIALQRPSAESPDRRPGNVLALTQARIGGGGMSLVDPEGSAYGPTLVPLAIFPDEGWRLEAAAAILASNALGKKAELTRKGVVTQTLNTDEVKTLVQAIAATLPLEGEMGRHLGTALDLVTELQRVQH